MSVHDRDAPDRKSAAKLRLQALLLTGEIDARAKYGRTGNGKSTDGVERAFYASGLPVHFANGLPVAPEESSKRSLQAVLKRGMDVVLASAALVLFLPLLAMVAIAIKIQDPGPALFRQPRLGLNGKRVNILKFRSMYLRDCSTEGTQQTAARDRRVMPLGRFLRRTSIDELPQLFNIIMGDMSLVGPRPHVCGQLAGGTPYENTLGYYDYRLKMRPGLTGWAQVNGYRGPTDNLALAHARVHHDVAYIQNFSILLDLYIIVTTLQREFMTGSGS